MTPLPVQNANPGDIKDPKTGKFRQFKSQADGWAALMNDLQAKVTGTSTTGINGNSTLYDFARTYAPKSDNNNPAQYTANLANKLKVRPDTKLSELKSRIPDFAQAVADNEGYINSLTPQKSVGSMLSPTTPPPATTGDQAQAASNPLTDYLTKGVAGLGIDVPVGDIVKKTYDTYKTAIPDFLEAAQSGQSSNPIVKVGEGALAATASGINTVFAPVTATVQSLVDKYVNPDNPDVQKFANLPGVKNILDLFSGASGKLDELSKAHPEAMKALSDALTIGLTAAGGEEGTVDKPIELKGGEAPKLSVTDAKTGETVLDSATKKSIQNTMPLQSKDVRINELRQSFPDSSKGGIARKGILGESTPQPNAADIKRGTIAHEYIKGESDPVKQIQKVNQGIQQTSKGVDTFLDSNSAPANFSDMRDYMEANNKPSVNIQKDPGAFESYKRATENALNTLYSTMKDTAKKTGDFGADTSGTDIRKARIAVDQQISKELGEETFGSPQYKGIKAAEIDTRNLLNRMSEDMLRYPGQMENLNRMNEFIRTAQGRGIEVDMTKPEVRAELEKQFGLKSTPESEANAQKLAQQHDKMSNLYEARDNMIDRYEKSVGKNKFQDFAKRHPTLVNVAKGAGIVAGYEELKKYIPILP